MKEETYKIYSVLDLNSPPVSLSRRNENETFYQHIPVPIPEQIVLFSLGPKDEVPDDVEITLTYKDETVTLGHLKAETRCFCWERSEKTLPEIMLSKKEKGMAKLLLERSEGSTSPRGPPVLEVMNSGTVLTEIKAEDTEYHLANEHTPQLLEQTENTPERPQKSKRRSSLNKSDKTPTGPSAKKQKTQKSSTRVRNLKADKTDSPQTSTETSSVCDKENKDSNVPSQTAEKKPSISVLPNSGSKQKVAVCKDLTTRASHPSSRWGHTLCFIHKNKSVLIGGQGDKQQLSKDSVWSLDTETRKWKCPEVSSGNQKPEYRMGHTATYDPMVQCIYVYGGSKNTRWFNDVHMLDVDEWKWQLVKVSGKAPTRAYHSATLYRHELWIFGGVYPRPDPQPDGCSNEIHIFSPVMESWYSPIVTGEKPLARSGHSATLIEDRLVVFGGWDAPISYSDLYILDMSIVEWTKPDIAGTPPKPRSWHASCALTGKRILIHGGYDGNLALQDTHIFSLEQLTWSQIAVNTEPPARVGHSAICIPYRHDNEEEDEVIIFGGGDNDGAYFDDLLNILVPFSPVLVSQAST